MKILYVTTISNTVNAFLIPHIKMLIKAGHQVDIAFNLKQKVNAELVKLGCVIYKIPFERSPLKKGNFKAYKMLKYLIRKEGYDLVHTHTPVASAITRLVCKKQNNVKVFYTAHGFHFYKGAPFLNWLLYYPVEKWLSKYTDVLITINKEDYNIAKSKLNARKVEYIHGVGINIEQLNKFLGTKALMRKDLGIPDKSFVLLSVGELNKNKNHRVILKCLAEINNTNIHYVVCGQGPLDQQLRNVSKKLGVDTQVHLLGYRKDIAEICNASDIFVFPSFREGLSVALMEAMANGLPVVCSKIRGNTDLIVEGEGGFLVEPSHIEGFTKYITKLQMDKKLRTAFSEYNKNKVKMYSIDTVLNNIKNITIKDAVI